MVKRQRTWRSMAARSIQSHTNALSVEEAVTVLAAEMLEGIKCPPADLDSMCAKAGITASASDELMGAGALINERGSLRILYASDLPLARRRFTIAHELGHLAINKTAESPVLPSKELERLCDMFATEVLLPKLAFLRSVEDGFHISMLPAVARRFHTSLTSTAIRYAELKQVSIFEVAEDRIQWGVGLVRRGFVSRIDDGLRPAIAKALSGSSGSDQAYLNINGSIRSCNVEYWPLGKTRRALILVRTAAAR